MLFVCRLGDTKENLFKLVSSYSTTKTEAEQTYQTSNFGKNTSCGPNGPLARYVKVRVAHAPRIPEMFSPPPPSTLKPLVSDPDMHHDTCVTHVPWCVSGSLTRGGGENVPGIPGACAICNFTYLARCTLRGICTVLNHICGLTVRWNSGVQSGMWTLWDGGLSQTLCI